MNVEKLLKFHLAMCYQAYQIMEKKNHDYAGAGGASPFRNFTSPEALGIASTEQGILIRMVDKVNRLVTFCRDGKLEVTNETATDAVIDIINYSVILAAYVQAKAAGAPAKPPSPIEELDDDGAESRDIAPEGSPNG